MAKPLLKHIRIFSPIFILLLFSLFLPAGQLHAQGGGCVCTNCPQFMPDLFTGSFFINVENASNPTLGQNGQGVCGVHIHFDHTAICDISITLTSPSGQVVTLVAPIGQFCTTQGNAGTDWDVTFLPCGDPAVSPDPGFSNTWNNNQNWGANNSYTGSYYPYTGCLQNFTGPVNGTWSLTVTDGQSNDVGNLYDYEIIFCDPSGIECFSCAANAGFLPQNDVVFCEADPGLVLNLPPSYTPPLLAPPVPEYSYGYVIGGAGGVIQAIQPTPDLTGFPAGNYTVCGLSYLTANAGDLPDPNGVLTVSQLTNQLNSTQPPFCGDVTTNCVGVTIKPLPPNEEEIVEICAPDCYNFHGEDFCQSGTFERQLVQNGCPYTATLYLTVHQPNFTTVFETICGGTCSANPLFPDACTTGTYQETVNNIFGCDSTVTLNLSVINPVAVIQPPPVLACGQPSANLSGTGSSTGGGITYQWTATNGGTIIGAANAINATIGSAGNYRLVVCRTVGGLTCCDTASVTVIADTNVPPTPAPIAGDSSICFGQNGTFSVATVAGATGYTWTLPAGVSFNSGQNTNSISVNWNSQNGGNICVTADNACGSSPPVCIPVTVDTIIVPAIPTGNTVVCAGATHTYSAAALPAGSTYNWTVAAPAILVSGQGTNQISVTWGNTPSGNVCVNTTGACGASAQACLPVVITSIPAIPMVSGNAVVCAGNTETYTLNPVPGATVYNWQVTGGTIAGGNGTATVQVLWDNLATSGSVCATAGNACGNSLPACLNITINPMLAAPVIAGDATLCPGDSGNYSILPINGASGYTWTVPAGSSLLSGQGSTGILVNWIAAPGGNVCVAANSGCGTGPQQCFPVLVNPTPAANAGADGAVCGTTFTLNAAGNGAWTTLAGPGSAAFVNANSNNTDVTASQHGLYVFQWAETIAGCTGTDTVEVRFNAAPVAGAVLETCDAANENFTVTIPISGGLAPYSVNTNPIAGSSFVSAPLTNGTTYSFTISDANGCTAGPVTGAFSCNCATNAGQMNLQALSACEGDSVTAQFLGGASLDANDTSAFVLHSGAGTALGTVFAKNHSGVFGLQPGMTPGVTYYISHTIGNNINSFPDPLDPCFSVAAGQPVVFYAYPTAMAGADTAVCDVTLQLNGNGSGSWSLVSTPAGGNLSLADPQNPASAATATQPGAYTLNWTVSANNCAASDQVVVEFYASPTLGTLQRDCDAANENYTVTMTITGGTAPYTVNGAPVAGATFISAPIANGAPYSFVVTDANGCTMPTVSGTYNCNCATNAGTLSGQTLFACEDGTVTAQSNNDQNLDGNDITAYVLHNGAGPALGQIFAQNNSGTFGLQAGMTAGQTYYISVVAGNPLNGFPDPLDPCFSVASGQPVVFLQIPTPAAGADDETCGQALDLQAANSGFAGTWTQASGPGNAVFAASGAPGSSVSAPAYGDYVFVWTETNNICIAADTVQIAFHEIPVVAALDEICNSTNTQYSVMFDVQGGAAPYTVSGLNGSFAGNAFTSAAVANGGAYQFVLTDANGCATGAIAGSHDCFCLTDAGNMVTTPALFCADTPASAIWDNNPALDGDDIVQFILHNQPGSIAGTIYATNTQPVFDFTGVLQTGTTYYISAIAGNNLAGAVDLNDPCLSVSPGTPVQWKPMPSASLTGDATVCAGSSTVLTFAGTGTFPLQISYSDGAGANALTLTGPQPSVLNLTPAASTTYTLLSVSDGSNPTCTTALGESVTIIVNQPVSAGTAGVPQELCAGVAMLIPLNSLLTGADAGGQWTEVSTLPSLPGGFNAAAGTFATGAQPAGTYNFRYAVPALAPCASASAVVGVVIHPTPNADAGADKILNCNHATVTAGGSGTTAGVQYQWLLNGAPAGATPTLEIAAPGDYTLVVTSAAGCTDADVVVVTQDLEVPSAFAISKKDVHCYGDDDGLIQVDSIVSSHPPVLVSLNQGPFGLATTFYPLAPGTYTVTLQDANGCEWESTPISVIQPPELLVDLGGDVEVTLGQEAFIQANISFPFTMLDTIEWMPLLDSLHAGMPVQQLFPLASQRVGIRVVDTNGCIATDRVTLVVKKLRHVYIPNVIRPNSTVNNSLMVYGGVDVEAIEMFQIFDRWGEKLFEATDFAPNDPAVQWAGKFKGKDVEGGVYVYYAVVRFIDGEQLILKGDVTVLR